MKSVPGLCVGVALGVIHVFMANYSNPLFIMPADNVSNMIITSAWHASKPKSNDLIPVFNHTPYDSPPLHFGKSFETIANLLVEHNICSEKIVSEFNISI
ncbi:Hypothetical protein CINCED_3A018395 [Cinara cedri]|uniref:Uncharacterized protein n=1 Tax=Cinara cedri TaxID=506608 RepID=A0A5E4N373_9HEMI|nr:Hypothetical protein CINCED_3A018395 [Cinara cedri]